MRTINQTSLATIPLILALGGCSHESTSGATDGQADWLATSTGSDTDVDTNGTAVDPNSTAPRLPIANSAMVRFVDTAGQPVHGAWIKHLNVVGDPDDPAPSKDPVYTADSSGHILVEGMNAGEQHWMIGAPGFATRTEVFSIDQGTRGSMTLRMIRLGETFMISTEEATDITYKNIDIHFPAGWMLNERTQEEYTGPVEATITVVNPTADNEDPAAVPLVGEDLNGVTSNLYSFGMIGVELRDPQSGDPLELNGQVTVKLSFHLDEEQTELIEKLGTNIIPAWHASPKRGDTQWKEIGAFVIQREKAEEGESEESKNFVATTYAVTEFSWVNFDLKVDDPTCHILQVVDGEGNPLQGKEVQINANNSWRSVMTDANGEVCYEQLPETSATLEVIPDEEIVNITSLPGQDTSVCAENNRPNYVDLPHNCKIHQVMIADELVCIPGSTWDCSDEKPLDDPNTDGVGICKAAEKICADGTEWSECLDPINPSPEVCTNGNEAQLDENCDGAVNEPYDENNMENQGCVGNCNFGDAKDCYPGPKAEEIFENSACSVGSQECSIEQTWGSCTGSALPNLSAEDCDPNNKVESCQQNPCQLNSLWWDSIGKPEFENGIPVNSSDYALSNFLDGNLITLISAANNSHLQNYGDCGGDELVTGVVTTILDTGEDSPEPNIPICPNNLSSPNVIRGDLDLSLTKADSGASGSAISSRANGPVEADGNAADCGAVDAGNSFIQRMNKNTTCLYRWALPPSYVVEDVAVGPNDTDVYAAVSLPANAQGNILGNCNFQALPGQHRTFFIRLNKQNNQVICSQTASPVPTPAEVRVAMVANTTVAAALNVTGNTLETWAYLFNQDLTPADLQLDSPVATFVDDMGNEFLPFDIAVSNNRVAITGAYKGSITLLGGAMVSTEGANNRDMLTLVIDPAQQNGLVSALTGHGTDTDFTDTGRTVDWVQYQDPFDPNDVTDALLLSATTSSKGFTLGNCALNQTNPDGVEELDSWVGLYRYSSNTILDSAENCILNQHAITGPDNQTISSVSPGNKRVALCGFHTNDIIKDGVVVEDWVTGGPHAHCGHAILPITPSN